MGHASYEHSKGPSTIITGIVVAIVGGLLLAWLVPRFTEPDLVGVNWEMYSEHPGTSIILLYVHNDGNKSAVGCTGHWSLEDMTGRQFVTLQSTGFWVPAHSDAIPLWGGINSKPVFQIFWNDYPPHGTQTTLTIYVSCAGYRSPDWKQSQTW